MVQPDHTAYKYGTAVDLFFRSALGKPCFTIYIQRFAGTGGSTSPDGLLSFQIFDILPSLQIVLNDYNSYIRL